MSYDFYVDFQIESEQDVKNLMRGYGKYAEIRDVLSRIMLLNNALGSNDEMKNYAKIGDRNSPSGMKVLIHSNGNFNDYIRCKLSELNLPYINMPINISELSKGSWLLEFPVILKKPFISKDDIPLYIIENPVRKDKVFGIPFTSAMSWKSNLRWTMMKVHLEPKANDPDEFADTRFKHTLLFGTEKGIEEEAKGLTAYLDNLFPEAKEKYRNKLKKLFETDEIPSLSGTLYFYPTFWNRIDMEVINPHERKTKTGKNPIYYEVVPAGAKGMFRLLFVPFYYLHLKGNELKKEVVGDLFNLISGIKEMMLTYGFSAKKSSGYGIIEDGWDSSASRIEIQNISNRVRFNNFKELEEEVKKILEAGSE